MAEPLLELLDLGESTTLLLVVTHHNTWKRRKHTILQLFIGKKRCKVSKLEVRFLSSVVSLLPFSFSRFLIDLSLPRFQHPRRIESRTPFSISPPLGRRRRSVSEGAGKIEIAGRRRRRRVARRGIAEVNTNGCINKFPSNGAKSYCFESAQYFLAHKCQFKKIGSLLSLSSPLFW